jgi:phage protein D
MIAAVQSIQVEDHAELADLVRIKLTVGVRPDGAGWTILDDDTFSRLASVQVGIRIGNARETLINAYVVETNVNFSAQPGQSILTVVAMDPTVLMNLEEKIKPWPDMADSDIAAAIFGDYGFTARVKDSQPARSDNEHRVIQRGTDITFLAQLAQRNGCECYVETSPSGEVEGHFHPPEVNQSAQGVLTLNMGEATNVSAFSVTYDMLKPVTVQAKGLEVESGSDQPAESLSQSGDELGSGASVPADRPRKILLAKTGLAKASELQTAAQAVVDRSAWAITAEGELNASTYGAVLRAKRPVTVRGAGRTLSGTYYVHRVLHTFTAEGYRQRFTLRRNALGLTGRETFTEDNAL